MKEVKLNGTMTTLSGVVVKDQKGEVKMNEFVADLLAGSKAEKEPVRQLNLAQAIWDNGDIELEDADYAILKAVVEKAEVSTLVIGQVLKAMGVKE